MKLFDELKRRGVVRVTIAYLAVGYLDSETTGLGGNPVTGGPRQPDAIAFSPDGDLIYSADEGELDFTGGRGWSSHRLQGGVVYADCHQLEEIAATCGQYPEGRSGNRGIEVEGIATACYGDRKFAFAISERGSFVGVYDIRNPHRPRFVQLLPTGIGPEGIATIPARGLMITADEVSGTLTIFEGRRDLPAGPQPLLPATQRPSGAF